LYSEKGKGKAYRERRSQEYERGEGEKGAKKKSLVVTP